MKLIIRMLALGLLLVLLAQTVSASSEPEFVAGNPECSDLGLQEIVKIDPPRDGTFGPIVLDVHGDTLDWTSSEAVAAVIVKGGPGANVYTSQNEGLHAPTNPNNGRFYGLSHVTFCRRGGFVRTPPVLIPPVVETLEPTNTPATPDSTATPEAPTLTATPGAPSTPETPSEIPPEIKLPQTGRRLE